MRLLFAAHGFSNPLLRVPQPGLLYYRAPFIEDLVLSLDLIGQGPLHVAEGIHILDLGPGPEGLGAHGPDGDIGVATQTAFLHVPVADLKVLEDRPQQPEVVGSLLGGAEVGFAHDLQEGNAGAVEVDVAERLGLVVKELSRVLLQVDAGDSHQFLFSIGSRDLHRAVDSERQLILGDLVSFGQVGIEVIFAGKEAEGGDLTVGGQCHSHGELHRLPVEDRERPGHAGADRTRMGVGISAEGG